MTKAPTRIEASPRVEILDYSPVQESYRDALLQTLSADPKAIPCRFLYDNEGSQLFNEVIELPDYYLTRAECEILAEKKKEIAAIIGPDAALIEFGPGSSLKARLVFDALERPVAYVPIDVSKHHLIRLAKEIADDNPELRVTALCADYTQPIELPDFGARRVGFFPGASIGNLNHDETRAFLELWAPQLTAGGAMIIGVDLKKEESVMTNAYTDPWGKSAEFTRTVLRRANVETGADFNEPTFEHRVWYDREGGRVRIELESQVDQDVTVEDQKFHFHKGERLHVQDSFKYTIEEFQGIARAAGYVPVAAWTDSKNLFCIHVLRVPEKNL